MPDAQKVKNIRHNPKVALSYSGSTDAEDYVVITGEARNDEAASPINQNPAYVEKYKQGIKDVGYTPESMALSFSVAIRVATIRLIQDVDGGYRLPSTTRRWNRSLFRRFALASVNGVG